MLSNLLSALRFLTVLPLGRDNHFDPHTALPYFPMAGLAIGLGLYCIDRIAAGLWSPSTAAVLDVLFLALISGGLHLDGLADTADGLYGRRDPQRALEIMKDSRIGTMGLMATLGCVAAKWAGLADLANDHGVLLILIPAYSRSTVLFAMASLPYGRPQGGTGQAFFTKQLGVFDFRGIGLVILLSFMSGWKMVILNSGFTLLTVILIFFYKKRMGCVTGDMLGAMIEISEATLFLLMAAGARG